MVRKSNRKDKEKGQSEIKGGIVNQTEEIADELSDGEEIHEGDHEKRQEMEKKPCTGLEKTNEPQPDELPPQADVELEGPLPDIEPC